MDAEVMKVEMDVEGCCVCGAADEELYSPEEHDAGAPPHQPPLRAMLLHLNNTKTVPSGRLCSGCIRRALEAYNFSTMLAAKGPPPLSEKIRALRKRLHELTQKIDVFIVVGGGAGAAGGAGGGYSEEDIIMVERAALAAADRADRADLLRAPCLRGDSVYHCTVCPSTFQRAADYRLHAGAHAAAALHSCWTCGAQFATRAAALAHAAAHAPRRLQCHLCSRSFQSQAEQRRHEPACPARCPLCGAVFPSRAELRAHAAGHAALCAACFLVCEDAAALQAHALAHRQDKQFVCGYDGCILRFATRNNLLAHIRKCHAGELAPPSGAAAAADVRCGRCDRTFATAAAARRHARAHRRAAPQEGAAEWTAEEEAEGRVEYLEVEALEDMEEAADL